MALASGPQQSIRGATRRQLRSRLKNFGGAVANSIRGITSAEARFPRRHTAAGLQRGRRPLVRLAVLGRDGSRAGQFSVHDSYAIAAGSNRERYVEGNPSMLPEYRPLLKECRRMITDQSTSCFEP